MAGADFAGPFFAGADFAATFFAAAFFAGTDIAGTDVDPDTLVSERDVPERADPDLAGAGFNAFAPFDPLPSISDSSSALASAAALELFNDLPTLVSASLSSGSSE